MLHGCFNSSEIVCQQHNCDVLRVKIECVFLRENTLKKISFLVSELSYKQKKHSPKRVHFLALKYLLRRVGSGGEGDGDGGSNAELALKLNGRTEGFRGVLDDG